MTEITNFIEIQEALVVEKSQQNGTYNVFRRDVPYLMNVEKIRVYSDSLKKEPVYWVLLKSQNEFRVLRVCWDEVMSISSFNFEMEEDVSLELQVSESRYLSFCPQSLECKSTFRKPVTYAAETSGMLDRLKKGLKSKVPAILISGDTRVAC